MSSSRPLTSLSFGYHGVAGGAARWNARLNSHSLPMAAFNVDASTSALQQRADESDLDPQAFLKSVRELSEKREREDAERYRALELEIEKSREERAVRRAGVYSRHAPCTHV